MIVVSQVFTFSVFFKHPVNCPLGVYSGRVKHRTAVVRVDQLRNFGTAENNTLRTSFIMLSMKL